MILLPEKKVSPVKEFIDSLNTIILKLIDLIMLSAPYGIFALLRYACCRGSEFRIICGSWSLFDYSFIWFSFNDFSLCDNCKVLTGKTPGEFFRGIAPAQLLAFSTSSSAATLPVTMECVEKNLRY